MARSEVHTENTQIIIQEDSTGRVAGAVQALNAEVVMEQQLIESFDVIKAIGRIEAAQFMETISEKLIVETALNVRETKKYRGLPYIGKDGKTGNISTFDEFCEIFLGKTGRRIRDLIGNYNAIGPDLYEQAERLGFRQRDYNALKALPSDDRKIIEEAIMAEDLDKALDLMQQMAAKHVREKESTQKKLEEIELTLEAKNRVITEKTEELNKKSETIGKLQAEKDRTPLPTPDELQEQLRGDVQAVSLRIKSDIMTELRKQTKLLMAHNRDNKVFLAGLFAEIGKELAILRDEYKIPDSVSTSLIEPWVDDELIATLNGDQARSELEH